MGNSNLVLQADRSLISNRYSNEPTGEAESLWGKITSKGFGDRVRPDADLIKKRKMNLEGVDAALLKKAAAAAGAKKKR